MDECGHPVILPGDTIVVLTCTLPIGHTPVGDHYDGDAEAVNRDVGGPAYPTRWHCIGTCAGGRNAHYLDEHGRLA